MAKLTKAAVKDLMAELAKVNAKIAKANADLGAERRPYDDKHLAAVGPVIEKHVKKTDPLFRRVSEIEAEINAFLNAQEKDIEIEESGYVAERKTQTKLLARVIDVRKFLDLAKKKGEAMYACISVGVKKAEDLLGKEIDQISERPEKREVVCSLRLK